MENTVNGDDDDDEQDEEEEEEKVLHDLVDDDKRGANAILDGAAQAKSAAPMVVRMENFIFLNYF